MVAGPAIASARGVTKTYRRGGELVRALQGVDLDVRAGEIVGIAGASGSGKSTLLAVLCGWERPESGSVWHVAGPVRELPWSDLAIVPQSLGLLDDLPALENVLLPARLTGQQAQCRARAVELLDRLGLGGLHGRFCDQMSLGQQQRLAIARALVLRPRLILADEPTAHQDHGWAEVVLELLHDQTRAGGAAVLVSHHQQALDRADRLLTMRDGVLHDVADEAA